MNEKKTNNSAREKVIVRASVIGIGANLVLSASKAAVGFFSGSIAVILDAVNNLSDALSSVITIAGTYLSGKKPDKEHPLGHGRYEYISAMLVSAIVLYAGVTALTESAKKIFSPEPCDYSALSLIVIASAVIVKLFLAGYVKKVGKSVNSASLIASGQDAFFDALLSSSVFISAIIYLFWGYSTEAYVGLLISFFIIKAGVGMFRETIDEIIGKRLDRAYLSEIKKTICSDECVHGAFDLILHSYGPEKYIGSVHVEISDTMTADEIDTMERRITDNVFQKHGVILAGIGIYSVNTTDDLVKAMRSNITHIVMAYDNVLQLHGFFVDTEKKNVHLDVILDFESENRENTIDDIRHALNTEYPDYQFYITEDIDV